MKPGHTALSVATALASAPAHLRASGSAALDAQLLLAHCLGRSRAWVLAAGETLLTPALLAEFQERVTRRSAGVPLAYLLGSREFWSLPLQVSPAVLVPRPETELVVERALCLVGTPTAAVVDLGTGSGAIALALASERPHWRVTATDRSDEALALATANARALNIHNVEFLAGDWFGPLAGQRFHLVASNPPYLAASDPALDDPALRHEPPVALIAAQGGIADLATLISGAPDHLYAGGWLVLEHGAGQADVVAALLVARGYTHVRCHTDLAGLPRVTEARWAAGHHSTVEPSP